jgi:hypothetical protein
VSTATGTVAAPAAGSTFVAATVANYGSAGLGVLASNEINIDGPHAIDNGYGVDALRIDFTSAATNLSSLTLGWYASTTTSNGNGSFTTDNNGSAANGGSKVTYNDSDLSVLYLSASSVWTLLGSYADVKNTALGLGTSIYASSWLISAYSSAYGVTGTGLSDGNDAFKVLTIAGNTCAGTVTNNACGPTTTTKVPEPGSLALIGAAMAGFVATRRRKSKAV